MARLRAILADLPGTPLRDVETFIASGNVVFTAAPKDTRDASAVAALERRIERQLEDALGWEVATFVRSVDALVALARATPFDGVADGHTLSVGFMHAPLAPDAQARLLALGDARNAFAVDGADVWWWTKGRLSESGIEPRRLERALGARPITVRNVTTVRRLATKYGS